ncbi:MAG TPA: hypothetical protein VES93_12060 [Ornithinibacter sp.]|nr:hypothetical protein [Ornithinibacter sp.]
MSIVRAVSVGSLVGAVAALSIYNAMGPDDMGRAAAAAPPTFAPVPTPTVTQLADCLAPAVLTKGICVTTKPGPRVVVQDPTPRAPATAPRTSGPATTDDGDDEYEDDDEHEDEDDEDDEDEDEDEEDEGDDD